jgi:hypothetical protein
MEDDNNVYIGRKGIIFIDNVRFPPSDSPWCNPFKINDNLSREEVIQLYRKYIIKKIKRKDFYL